MLFHKPHRPVRKAAINVVWMHSSRFIENSFPITMIGRFALRTDRRLEIRKRQPVGRQIDQAAGSAQYLVAALCPRATAAAYRGIPARAARRRAVGPRVLYRRYLAAAAAPDDPERRHADVVRLWPHRQGPLSRRISRGQARALRDGDLLRMRAP